MFQAKEGELFYFGLALNKFAPHKGARILGLSAVPIDQDGRIRKCFLLEYPDGECARAEFFPESQGSFELLTYDEGVRKYGENAFQ